MRKVIFDLDRTLWRCTVEYHPRLKMPRPFSGTDQMLQSLTPLADLSIASRSCQPEKCRTFLNQLFPTISFSSIEIYPTILSKVSHVLSIVDGNTSDDFLFIDDEPQILRVLDRTFPRCVTILRDPSLSCDELFHTILPYLDPKN